MKRYHQKICFPKEYNNQLQGLTDKFNNMEGFKKSSHAIEQLKTRFNLMEALQFLKNRIYFKYQDIFEYYTESNQVIKICYKMEYNQYNDLIIVLDRRKMIITLYLNSKNDNHKTLKKELYTVV